MKFFITFSLCGFIALASCDSGGEPGGKSSVDLAGGGGGSKPASSSGDQLDFTLKDLDGKDVSLSSFRGKAVLLNFWAVG